MLFPLLSWALLAPQAAADDARAGDLVNTQVVAASPAGMVDVLIDLPTFGRLLPPDCVGYFKVGLTPKGLGAQATVRYDMAAMHRKLELTVSRIERDEMWMVDMNHAGNRGFISRWVMVPGADGTAVTLKTPLNAPPWPFAGYFFDTVHPEWEGCQDRMITAVAAEALRLTPPVVEPAPTVVPEAVLGEPPPAG